MSKTRLFLVRHAVAEPSPQVAEAAWPLSPAGHNQAKGLADALHGEPIGEIWSSPYQRAFDTVVPLADRLACQPQVHAGLRERRWADAWLDDFAPHLERSFREPDFKLPGGESSRDALRRFDAALIEIACAAQSEHVVVGTHGNVLSLFLRSLDPRVDFQFWKDLPYAVVYGVDWDGSFHWQR
jgi:2,3-bisphosphoglycerate-dependent phosphoglycerate mutase